MTTEELEHLILKGPTEELVAALVKLNEPERKKLSKHLAAMRKKITERHAERNSFMNNLSVYIWGRPEGRRINLAMMGIGPWTETKRIRSTDLLECRHHQNYDPQPLLQILRHRRPDWLPKWVEKELAERFVNDWGFIRLLIREGLCPKPQSEQYILGMLFAHLYDRTKSLKDNLLEDPELLTDEIWKIFELCPTRGTILDVSDITIGESHPDASWAVTLKTLAAEGHLDRRRLLEASLGSLTRNTEARNTAWFCKFHELLEPTVEERGRLQTTYLQLLSHRVPVVVGMALDALKIVESSQQLNVPEFMRSVEVVFHLQPKAHPLAAVKLLGKLATREPKRQRDVAAVLLRGLAHPHAQVQQAIVDLLARFNKACKDVIAEQLSGVITSLAPSVQASAHVLLGQTDKVSAGTESPVALDALLKEAEQVVSPWREWAGIDGVLGAIRGTNPLSSVAFDSMSVPRLDPDQRVQPIQTLDELIERLTVAVESLNDPIEYELLLDGLSRLCDQRPADFAARLAPLIRRVEKPLFLLPGMQISLNDMIKSWALDAPSTEVILEYGNSLLAFQSKRLSLITARMRQRQAAPLCACPTHRLGWIDPQEMLHRLKWYEEHGLEPDFHDMVQGLLRLAPDGRAEVLAQATPLKGRYGSAFRYALGGPLEDELTGVLGMIAGRARHPFAERLDVATSVDYGPDATHAAQYTWEFIKSSDSSSTSKTVISVKVHPQPAVSSLIHHVPTVLLHNYRVFDGWNRWAGTVWPANPQPFFASGVRLQYRSYSDAQIKRQRAEYLDPLFDPDVPFSTMAQWLLALALGAGEPEVTGLAVDALIVLIRDGRCVGPELGEVMGSLMAVNELKLNRIAQHLETVGQASLLHAYVCSQMLQIACCRLQENTRDLHHVLSRLLEWLSALKQPVREDFKPVLDKVTTGKAGQLSKRLKGLAPSSHDNVYLTEALEGRLERIRRWIASHRTSQKMD
ncbi:MAG: hypothetical protein JNJ77_10475 [Planctomycetia bacterium]|nr:hypothetical protein [Planctomycetia bacterium]